MSSYNNKIDIRFMDVDSFGLLEDVKCVICGSDQTRLVTVQDWFGESFHVVRCVRCKLMFTNPRPTTEWRERYYDPQYNPLMKYIERDFIHLETPGRLAAYKRLLEFLKDEIHPGIKLLDGGCAAGQSVKIAIEKGFDATGVEYSPGAITYAHDHFGLELIQARVEDIPVPDNTYDVVTLLQVFEHFPNPATALQEVKRVLKPGGILFIETPNYLRFYLMEKYLVLLKKIYLKFKSRYTDSWGKDIPWFPFDHYYHWTPETLLLALNKAGFNHNKIHFIKNYHTQMLPNGSLSTLKSMDASFSGALYNLTKGRLNLWSVLTATAVKP